MNIQVIIADIKTALTTTFAAIDSWFDQDTELRSYRPQSKGWTIDEILEHIALTNRFLLILIEKGARKALLNAEKQDLQAALQNYTFHHEQLTEVALPQSFSWIRPEHMEPKGEKTPDEVRHQLKAQISQCLDTLERLKNGEGVLYLTTMTVNDLGKIDVYEYIYFLAQHGKRHLTQMQKNEAEFRFELQQPLK